MRNNGEGQKDCDGRNSRVVDRGQLSVRSSLESGKGMGGERAFVGQASFGQEGGRYSRKNSSLSLRLKVSNEWNGRGRGEARG